jgi:cysteine-rich repeat protein
MRRISWNLLARLMLVYVIDAPDWGQVKKLTAADAAADDRFGTSVSLRGDTVVIGAREDDLVPGVNCGSAYVFERHAGGTNNWGQVKKLTASDATGADRFGSSVSLSGDTIAIGAFEDDGAGVDSGSAYVFDRHAGGTDNWGQVKELNASDPAGSDQFGASVSISADTVAVGAPNKDLNASFVDQGFVYVFERNVGGGDNWGQVQKLGHSASTLLDKLGYSVSIDGDRIVAGAPESDGAGGSSGSAYVYHRDGAGVGSWGEVERLTAADAASLDLFGGSVSISGTTIVAGARGDADAGANSGSAYVFYRILVCGDGLRESPEACDDGNSMGGDECAADCSVADTGVPGEASPAEDMLVADTGSIVEAIFSPACSATDHAVYWGYGPIGPAGLEWIGSACGLGTDGTATFDPGPLLPREWLYFVMVGYDGDDEGSYGADSALAQRPEAVGLGACDRPVGSSTCP